MFHMRQDVGQLLRRFVVNDQVFFGKFAAQFHHFWFEAVQAHAFVVVFAKNQRFAMFQINYMVGTGTPVVNFIAF